MFYIYIYHICKSKAIPGLHGPRILPEHDVRVLQLGAVEEGIHLHGHHAGEGVAGVPNEPQLVTPIALRLEVALQSVVVEPQELKSHV